MAYAGLDVGTSGCKLMVFDLDGNVLYRASRSYQETGEGLTRELDGNVVRSNVRDLLKETGQHCPCRIDGLSVAGIGESVICVDGNGRILANSLLTGDYRGREQLKRIMDKYGVRRIFEITGLPPNELYGLPKYAWLNENSDTIRKSAHIFLFEDYISYLLTGRCCVSYSSAARSLAFDIHRKTWSEELLAEAGITPGQMSEPVPPFTVIGTILPQVAQELHLNPRMKIVVGAHDQTAAAVGSGLRDEFTAEYGLGTCGFMFMQIPEGNDPDYMIRNDFTYIPWVVGSRYLTSLEITTCGALKNWARDNILTAFRDECRSSGRNFFAEIENRVKDLRTTVNVLPQFGSAGNPDMTMTAYGSMTGLTIHTSPFEIYRAILEAFSFQIRLCCERQEKLGVSVKRIVATGGGAASDTTLQIMADVMGVPVYTTTSQESGDLGCMMMAAVGGGAYSNLMQAMERAVHYRKEFRPDSGMCDYYSRKYKEYSELYRKMHSAGLTVA